MADDKKVEASKTKVEAKDVVNTPMPLVVEEPVKVDPMIKLREKADLVGVAYENSDTSDVLRAKIDAKLNPPVAKDEDENEVENPATKFKKGETQGELRQRVHAETMFLVKCRITNMNPAKADLQGEMFTVSNSYIGALTRFIPYGEQLDGWYIEKIMLDHLMDRKFQQIRKSRNSSGQDIPETKWVKEFAIEILPYPTKEELRVLANQQAAAAGQVV